MNPVKIFVEGGRVNRSVRSSDSRFLKECIRHWFKREVDLENDFEYIGGAAGLKDMAPTISEEQVLNHDVVVIIDANGDFDERKAFVERFRQENNLSFQFFLFPDNNSKGEVETLIEAIATKRNFIDCFNNYQNCIGKTLDLKDKVFAYIEAASANPKDANEANRKFSAELFDFDHPALNPLKEFLTPFFG